MEGGALPTVGLSRIVRRGKVAARARKGNDDQETGAGRRPEWTNVMQS